MKGPVQAHPDGKCGSEGGGSGYLIAAHTACPKQVGTSPGLVVNHGKVKGQASD